MTNVHIFHDKYEQWVRELKRLDAAKTFGAPQEEVDQIEANVQVLGANLNEFAARNNTECRYPRNIGWPSELDLLAPEQMPAVTLQELFGDTK
jgi:hypothetical protein